MDKYKIKITSQAKDHLRLIQEYIAIELKVPSIAKKKKRDITCKTCDISFCECNIGHLFMQKQANKVEME